MDLFFDGYKCIHGAGGGIILINTNDDVIPMSHHLIFYCINNMEEYEALSLGMKAVILLKLKRIKIFGDSQLIMNQVSNIYNKKYPKLQPYKEKVENLFIYFNEYEIDNIPRDRNRYTNLMANVTSLTPIPTEDEDTILTIKIIGKPSHDFVVEDFIEDHYFSSTWINACEWYQDILNYLKYGVIPITFDHNSRIILKKLDSKYVILGDLLYRRSFDGSLLICLMRHEVDMALHQAHDGEYGRNFSTKFFYQNFLRLDYYWPTMLEDCELHIKKCEQYQKNASLQPSSSHAFHSIVSPSPFSIWYLILLVKLTLFQEMTISLSL